MSTRWATYWLSWLFGQISDQLGRKRAAVPALILASVSAALFLFAAGTSWLFFGRTLIGLAVGVASGTGTAWLAELYGPSRRPRATLTATTANLAGIGLGPVAGGLLAEYARWPLRLVFLCYIACVMLLATAVARLPATEGPTRRLSEVRVKPRLGVPRHLIGAFTPPAVCAFVIFALGVVYSLLSQAS